MNTWIERTCRVRCLWQSLLAGAGTLVSLAIARPVMSQSVDDLSGPHPLTADILLRAGWPDDLSHRFVEVEVGETFDTGVVWQEEHRSNGTVTSRTTTPFWGARIGEKILLVRSPDKPSGKFAGKVEHAEWSVLDKFDERDRPRILTVVVTDEDPRVWDVVGDSIVVALLGWTGWLTFRSARRFADPRRHPAVARLAADGDLRDLSKAAEKEVGGSDAWRFRGAVFTPSFFFDRRWPRFQVRRWTDLAWVYLSIKQHHLHHIPAGQSHALVLLFDDGTKVKVKKWTTSSSVEKHVKAALERAAMLAPWAVRGFDDMRKRAWKRDRAGFLAAVARRRAELVRPPVKSG
jgi:hypothetical protein